MISDLSGRELAERLRAGELVYSCGPFTVRVASPVRYIAEGLRLLYADYALTDEYADFSLELTPSGGVRRWVRPKVVFTSDRQLPFAPFPLDQAYPLFEWSLNWCIASVTQQYLIIHAAAVERDDRVAILPGLPGTGKSTLAAALVNRGWRLFSDELTLIDIETGRIVPLPRPISLKDKSIDTIRAFAPDAVFNRPTYNTAKGTISHMKAARTTFGARARRRRPDGSSSPNMSPAPRRSSRRTRSRTRCSSSRAILSTTASSGGPASNCCATPSTRATVSLSNMAALTMRSQPSIACG